MRPTEHLNDARIERLDIGHIDRTLETRLLIDVYRTTSTVVRHDSNEGALMRNCSRDSRHGVPEATILLDGSVFRNSANTRWRCKRVRSCVPFSFRWTMSAWLSWWNCTQ